MTAHPTTLPPAPADARFRHVACCYDGSPEARAALAEARRRLAPGGRLSAVCAEAGPLVPLVSLEGAVWIPDLAELREDLERWLREELREIPGAEPVFLEGPPGSALCAWAREAGVDLLVAPRERPLARLLRGGVLRALLKGAPCPILVVDARLTPAPLVARPAAAPA